MARLDPIESALARALAAITGPVTPPRLRAAMRHALFPGGARVRPRLAWAVAEASPRFDHESAGVAGSAVELIHCASLVHDDLPCFDDATLRRGIETVHVAFGEPIAVLVGDGLIVGAFDVLARTTVERPHMAAAIGELARAVGAARGLVAGQAWEAEPVADVRRYHRAKTGALFEAAVCLGAIAGGSDPEAWRPLGAALGEAYQIADDIRDLTASASELGKPVGRDLELGRPSAAVELGVEGALARLDESLARLAERVPACPGREAFCRWLGETVTAVFPRRRPAAACEHGLFAFEAPLSA